MPVSGAVVDADAWPLPRLFAFLQAGGSIEPGELARTFNCGIGMILVVAPDRAGALSALLAQAGETVVPMGRVGPGQGVAYRGRLL